MSSSSSSSIVSSTQQYLPELSTGNTLPYLLSAYDELEDSGSSTEHRAYIERFREEVHEVVICDYFVDQPKFPDHNFRQRFRLNKSLFFKIVGDIEAQFEWFQEGVDGRGKSFTPIQKCTSDLRQLATGEPPHRFNDYLCMSARTSRERLQSFCGAIIDLYSLEFLRKPTSHGVARLYDAHEEKHHILGMLGSIDCAHFAWRNCPKDLKGQYKRDGHEHPTIMLEVVASNDLWIWHACIGQPGSNNDVNVLNRSPLYLTKRNGTDHSFVLNRRLYKRGYYLTDGTYPRCSTFVKAYLWPTDPKEKNSRNYKSRQERMSNEPWVFLRQSGGFCNVTYGL